MRAHDDVVEVKSSHDGNQQATSSHDDARTFHWKPRVVHPIGESFGGQRAKNVFGRALGENHAVQSCGVEVLQTKFNGGDRHDAAGDAHHTLCFDQRRKLNRRVVDGVTHHRNGIREFFGAWRVAMQLGLGKGHHAEGKAHAGERR